LVSALVVIVPIGFVVRAAVRSWDEASAAFTDAQPALLAAAALSGAAGMIAIAVLWQRLLFATGERPPLGSTLRWYFIGEVAKYVPGGIWPVVGRAELARRGGIDRGRAYSATTVSLICLVASSAVFGGIMTIASGQRYGLAAMLLAAGGALLAALHPWWLDAFGRRIGFVARLRAKLHLIPLGRIAPIVPAYAIAWLGIVGSAVLVAAAVDDQVSTVRVAAAVLTSWFVGFVIVPVPGGLGVRESLFIALSGMPEGAAVTVALLSRALLLVVDIGGAGIALALSPALRRRREVTT
jgi:glycosyltransferase 2 family protein